MGAVDTSERLTARSVLYGRNDRGTALRKALHGADLTPRLAPALDAAPGAIGEAAIDEMTKVVADALDVELPPVLLGAWAKYEALTQAARRTLANPGSEEIVELASHRITAAYRPRIDVILDGVKIDEIDLEIDVEFDVRLACGVVTAGRLTALRSGKADVHIEFRCGALKASASQELDLPITISLGAGLVLAEDRGAEPSPVPGADATRGS